MRDACACIEMGTNVAYGGRRYPAGFFKPGQLLGGKEFSESPLGCCGCNRLKLEQNNSGAPRIREAGICSASIAIRTETLCENF